MRRHLLAFLILASCRCALAFESADAFGSFLAEHGVGFDKTNAAGAAVMGMLKAIDPDARFCSTQEVAALRERLQGWRNGVTNASALDAVELWPEGLAYLKVRGLFGGSGAEIDSNLRALEGRAGVILDLRGADGTDLNSAARLASPYHCPGDVLFTVQNSNRDNLSTNVAIGAAERHVPLMLLTDNGTACAAELLAALCRGSPGVMLLGMPTRGDARVREILDLPDGRCLYIATAKVALDAGSGYDGTGVQPDICVSSLASLDTPFGVSAGRGRPASAKTSRDRDLMMRVDGDAVLRRATDILLGIRALGDYGRP